MILKDWQIQILKKKEMEHKSKKWFREKMSVAFVMLRNNHGRTNEEIDAMQSLFDMTIELMDED